MNIQHQIFRKSQGRSYVGTVTLVGLRAPPSIDGGVVFQINLTCSLDQPLSRAAAEVIGR